MKFGTWGSLVLLALGIALLADVLVEETLRGSNNWFEGLASLLFIVVGSFSLAQVLDR